MYASYLATSRNLKTLPLLLYFILCPAAWNIYVIAGTLTVILDQEG